MFLQKRACLLVPYSNHLMGINMKVTKEEMSLNRLFQLLRAGEVLEVADAKYSRDYWCVGDLIREGMVKEHKFKKWRNGSEYLVNYSIEEPIHVIIGGKLYQEGSE